MCSGYATEAYGTGGNEIIAEVVAARVIHPGDTLVLLVDPARFLDDETVDRLSRRAKAQLPPDVGVIVTNVDQIEVLRKEASREPSQQSGGMAAST